MRAREQELNQANGEGEGVQAERWEGRQERLKRSASTGKEEVRK